MGRTRFVDLTFEVKGRVYDKKEKDYSSYDTIVDMDKLYPVNNFCEIALSTSETLRCTEKYESYCNNEYKKFIVDGNNEQLTAQIIKIGKVRIDKGFIFDDEYTKLTVRFTSHLMPKKIDISKYLKHQSISHHVDERFINVPITFREGAEIDIVLAPNKKTYKLSYDGTILSHKEERVEYKDRLHHENSSLGTAQLVVCEDYDAWWYNKEIEQGHIVKFTVDRGGYLVTIDRGYDRKKDLGDESDETIYIGGRFSKIVQCLQWCRIDEAECRADGITWKSINMRVGDEVCIRYAKEKGICLSFENGSKNVYTMSDKTLYWQLAEVAKAYEQGYKVVSTISNVEQIRQPIRRCYMYDGVYTALGIYLWIDSIVDREIVHKNQSGNFDKNFEEYMSADDYESYDDDDGYREQGSNVSFGGFTGNPNIGDW